MRQYFVISDIHGFYIEMVKSLSEKGFDKDDPNHILIVLGDIFDRGPNCKKVYQFLSKIPQNRLILIKGNHEYLYLELLKKRYPERHDFMNYTVNTFCQIANITNVDSDYIDPVQILEEGLYKREYVLRNEQLDKYYALWNEIKNKVSRSVITKWLKSKEWLNYFELGKYIFVHSFIPTKLKVEYEQVKNDPFFAVNEEYKEYDPDWRKGNWYEASWGRPWSQYIKGMFKPESDNGKVLVCGHWHTDDFYKNIDNDITHIGDIYYGKNIIAIDGGVYKKLNEDFEYEFVHFQNVLILKI